MKKQISLTITALIGMILVSLLSIAIYFTVYVPTTRSILVEDIVSSNNEIARSTADYLDTKINEQISLLMSIEIAHHTIDSEDGVFDDVFYEKSLEFSDFLTDIELVNLDGVIIYSSVEEYNRVGVDLSNHELVKQVADYHEVYIGSLVFNTDTEELSLEVLYSGENMNVKGLIGIEFFTTYGDNFTLSFDNKEMIIVDSNGIFLYDSKNDEHLIKNRFKDFDNLDQNEDSFMEINGVESIFSVVSMDLNDWKVIVYESVDSGLLPLSLTVRYFSFTVIFIVIMYILIFLAFSNAVRKETRTLLDFFDNISRGYFDKKLSNTRFSEFSVLRKNFTAMSNQLHDTQKELEHTAYHDKVSGLQSKAKAAVDFEEIKELGEWEFVYFDIERFSLINDNYGYEFGDNVIKRLGEFLSSFFNFVYRVEGDEFLVLRPKRLSKSIKSVLIELNNELEKGEAIEGINVPLSLKAGISVYPDDGEEFYDLLQKSMIALRELEKEKTDIFRLYRKEFSDVYERLSKVEYLITKALDENEFSIEYQPIVNAKTKKIRGFESLSRWYSEELGYVSPAEFIPVLEHTNRIHILDLKVLEDAIKLNVELSNKYPISMVASVNLSVETIMKPNFISLVEKLLKKYEYPSHLLELEITESVFIDDFQAVTQKISHLRNIGVKFSEDDFGDAYSSLTYLSRLKIDTLKISRNFLSTLLSSDETKLLVRSILELANGLGLKTVVEGIEHEETYQLFKNYGCDYIQGYLFYKPMEKSDFADLIKSESEEEA